MRNWNGCPHSEALAEFERRQEIEANKEEEEEGESGYNFYNEYDVDWLNIAQNLLERDYKQLIESLKAKDNTQ